LEERELINVQAYAPGSCFFNPSAEETATQFQTRSAAETVKFTRINNFLRPLDTL
jgi:hypothetical protein